MKTHSSRDLWRGRIGLAVILACVGFFNAGVAGLLKPAPSFPAEPSSFLSLTASSTDFVSSQGSPSFVASTGHHDRQNSIEKLINSKWQAYRAFAVSS